MENHIREYDAELIRIVEEFRQRVKAGTSDPENFLTISEIERMWSELRGETSLLYSDMLSEILANIDESKIIRKKKQSTEKRE
jgi:hypothetical protein